MPSGRSIALVALLAAASDCGPRCFRDASPPPARVSEEHTLLVGISPSQRSPAACPRDRPADGEACLLPRLQASDAEGHPVELWDTCYYAHAGAPCDPDACTCKRTNPNAAPTFACTDRIVIE